MPRPAINDYIFYKIVNVNGDCDLCYVGSTANFKQRKIHHKMTCNNEKVKNYNCKLYQTIREQGGWNEFKIIEIGKAEQITLTEAHKLEEGYRVELKANMNMMKCFRSNEEATAYKSKWYYDNIEINREKQKQYAIDNADKIREYSKKWRSENLERKKEMDKQYRIDNANKIKEQRSIIHTCDCGGVWTDSHKSRHLKSKKHQDYIKSINLDI